MKKFQINLSESFRHLPGAPIVEAVFDIRARPSTPLHENTLRTKLKGKLLEYDFLDSQQLIQHEFRIEAGKPSSQKIENPVWKGLRYCDKSKSQIVNFSNDGFSFSRLEPYVTWEDLYDEAIKLWQIYLEIAKPKMIDRVGLRYINSIQLPNGDLDLEDYMYSSPQPPKDLDFTFTGFIHQDTLTTPDDIYGMNIIKTIQPSTDPNSGLALIIDIDVFCTFEFELDEEKLKKRLLEMRWLKNKIFFGSVTEKTLELFE